MTLALMRTAPGKEDLGVSSAAEDKFIRVTSLRNHKLTTTQIRAHINALQSSSSRHIPTSTVQRKLLNQPSWSDCCREAATEEEQRQEENCFGQETQGMNRRSFWFHLPCLCETQKWWADGFYMCSSHREAQWRRCDGVGVLYWWHGSVIYSKFKAHLNSKTTTATSCPI